jgi:hypothetical protein
MQVFVYTVNELLGSISMAVSRPSVPTILKPRFDEIVSLTDAVCRTHLTDEYAALARELAVALARKRGDRKY